jgi:hypothetical protein
MQQLHQEQIQQLQQQLQEQKAAAEAELDKTRAQQQQLEQNMGVLRQAVVLSVGALNGVLGGDTLGELQELQVAPLAEHLQVGRGATAVIEHNCGPASGIPGGIVYLITHISHCREYAEVAYLQWCLIQLFTQSLWHQQGGELLVPTGLIFTTRHALKKAGPLG